MLSKRKLSVILPMLFELAMGYDYYFMPGITQFGYTSVNHWGRDGPANDENKINIGSIGGGYYGREVPGLRDHEKGEAKGEASKRLFGGLKQSYPYTLESHRILGKDSLKSLSPEALLRLLREPFKEMIYNITGNIPTLKEMKKLEPQFKDFVRKELNLTSSEVKSLFGVPTTKGRDGRLPKYLLFDDMDSFDFDPEEALKFMPRLSKNATKEEVDGAYLKAWEMLGKSDKRLKQVYKAYRRKYLESNPLGPVMTEKEFLLYSIKLREREAQRLGFIPSSPYLGPVERNVQISYFLRDALKEEYERYKSQNPEDKLTSARKFFYDALFGDKLIMDQELESPETIPSPYDPIEGRAWTNTTANSKIISIEEAHDNISKGGLYNERGNLVTYITPEEEEYMDDNGLSPEELPEGEQGAPAEPTLLHTLTRFRKNIAVKSPSQQLFESSQYSSSAQKRVINSLEDFTLIRVEDMTSEQVTKLVKLLRSDLHSKLEKEEEKKYFQQRLGERGGDTGTNIETNRRFLYKMSSKGLFFIPKEINLVNEEHSGRTPVSAVGFELIEINDGVAKIRHAYTNLSFDIDYSGKNDFYLNGYLGFINEVNPLSPDVKHFISTGWRISESQVPSSHRLVSKIDEEMSKFTKIDNSFYQTREALLESGTEQDAEIARQLSDYLALSSKLLKKYEESRNAYIRSQERLLDELNKSKSIFRSGILLENLRRVSNGLSGEENEVDVPKFMDGLSRRKLEEFLKQKDELEKFTVEEYEEIKKRLEKAKVDCLRSYNSLLYAVTDLAAESSKVTGDLKRTNSELVQKLSGSIKEKRRLENNIRSDLHKLDITNDYLSENVNLALSLSASSPEIDGFLNLNKDSSVLENEVMAIFNGLMKAEEYKKLIDNTKFSTRYGLVKPLGIFDRHREDDKREDDKREDDKREDDKREDDKREDDKREDVKREDVKKHPMSFKDRAKKVFEESMTIILEYVRDLYIKYTKMEERLKELLDLEAFLINQLSMHRRSLSVVINKPVFPEDEIINESETDELKIRILLKILEEKTKLIYTRDIINKLYFYPYFPGLKQSMSMKLISLEEEGIKSSLGFTYYPKFRYDEDKYPIGIYGFRRIDHFDYRDELFGRLLSGFEYDTLNFVFELELSNLLEDLDNSKLTSLILSDCYIESSILSKKAMLIQLLKKLISEETNKVRRRGLKMAYFEIKKWFDAAITNEEEKQGSSSLSYFLIRPFACGFGSNAWHPALVLSEEKRLPSSSRNKRRRMRQKN